MPMEGDDKKINSKLPSKTKETAQVREIGIYVIDGLYQPCYWQLIVFSAK